MTKTVWNDNVHTLPDTITQTSHVLNIPITSFFKAIFLSDDIIALADGKEKTIYVYSLSKRSVMCKLAHSDDGDNSEIEDLFLFKDKLLSYDSARNIYLWDFRKGHKISNTRLTDDIYSSTLSPLDAERDTILYSRRNLIQVISIFCTKLFGRYPRPVESKRGEVVDGEVSSTAKVYGDRVYVRGSYNFLELDAKSLNVLRQIREYNNMICDSFITVICVSERFVAYLGNDAFVVRDRESLNIVRTLGNVTISLGLTRSFSAESFNIHALSLSLLGEYLYIHFRRAPKSGSAEPCNDIRCVVSITSGEVVFKQASKRMRREDYEVSELTEKGIIIGDGNILKLIPIPGLLSAASTSSQPCSSSTLISAYIECLQQRNQTPAAVCENVVSYELTKSSLMNLLIAHRILMLAVQDGTVGKNADSPRTAMKWFSEIYSAAREISVSSEADMEALRETLAEAEVADILEGRNFITSRLPNRPYEGTQDSLGLVGKQIFTSLLNDEKLSLTRSLQKYQQSQNMTGLVRISMCLMPMIYNSTATAVSHCTQLLKGMQVKTFTQPAIQMGISSLGRSDSFEKRLLLFVAQRLDPALVGVMDDGAMDKLLTTISRAGTSAQTLQHLLLNGITENYELPSTVKAKLRQPEAVTESLRVLGLMENFIEKNAAASDIEPPTAVAVADAGADCAVTSKTPENATVQATPAVESSSVSSSPTLDLSSWSFEDLAGYQLTTENVSRLSEANCAALLAAYAVQYDSEKREKFVELQKTLSGAMMKLEMDGLILTNRESLSSEELAELIMDELSSGTSGNATNRFLKIKIKTFLDKFQD